MTRVIAAVDNSAAARPVLVVAGAVGHALDAAVEAVHVQQDGDDTVRAEAAAAGTPLSVVSGDPVNVLRGMAAKPDVAALVLGMRRTPSGTRPAGSVARAVASTVAQAVVLVPPECRPSPRIRRVLVPMSGDPSTAASLQTTIEVIRAREIDVVVLHVYDESSVPAFNDQPQHEHDAWAREFLARYVRLPENVVRLELRVGVPSEEVLAAAHDADVDVIALGWGQDLSPGRAGIVRPVLERATTPVLLLPVVRAAGSMVGSRNAAIASA